MAIPRYPELRKALAPCRGLKPIVQIVRIAMFDLPFSTAVIAPSDLTQRHIFSFGKGLPRLPPFREG
jgi:hypothetical protein